MDRTYTNSYIRTKINEALATAKQKNIQPLTEVRKEYRIKCLAKLINAGIDEPGTAVTFNPRTLEPIDHGKKRVGRPKLNWYQITIQDFWLKANNKLQKPNMRLYLIKKNPVHVNAIKAYAHEIAK